MPLSPADIRAIATGVGLSRTNERRLVETCAAIDQKIGQCAQDFGMSERFEFAIWTQFMLTTEQLEELSKRYIAAGWKSLEYTGGGSSGSGFTTTFLISAT